MDRSTVHERVVTARMMRALRATVLFRHGITDSELRAYYHAKIVILSIVALMVMFLVAGVASADCVGPCRDIAVTLSDEAGGEGEQGMRAVGSVIANRSKAWNKTPHQIVTAKNQFYGYTAKNRLLRYREVKPIADKIALEIMAGTIKDTVNGGLYFRTAKEKRFKWCKVETARVFNHIFYK